MQRGDILLNKSNNNGDICVENGAITLTGGFETAIFLSLFGGNENDAGGSDRTNQYWANINEISDDVKYISQTQFLLNTIPLTSSNLLRIEDTIRQDLNWLISLNIASNIGITTSIKGFNKLQVTINIRADGNENEFTFTENWKASK